MWFCQQISDVCTVTQADQDNADDEKQRESMHALIQTWLDSLQLISVIVSKFPTLSNRVHLEL